MSAVALGHPARRTRRRVPLAHRVPVTVSRICWYALCILLAVTMLVPLLWMVSIALKSNDNILQLPPRFLPTSYVWSNFINGPAQIHFPRLFVNTVIITVVSTAGAVTSSMLAGYALSRLEFKGRKTFFYLFTFAIFVPSIVTVIPIERLFFGMGMINTWVPLILPSFFGNPLFIFLARQFFISVPHSIDESAMMDGASSFRIFRSLMVPLTKPLWITMAILAFQMSWNDYLSPLIYLNSPGRYTLSLGMATFMGTLTSGTTPQYNYYMASNLLYMIPPLLLFFFAQRYFMMGLGSLGMTNK